MTTYEPPWALLPAHQHRHEWNISQSAPLGTASCTPGTMFLWPSRSVDARTFYHLSFLLYLEASPYRNHSVQASNSASTWFVNSAWVSMSALPTPALQHAAHKPQRGIPWCIPGHDGPSHAIPCIPGHDGPYIMQLTQATMGRTSCNSHRPRWAGLARNHLYPHIDNGVGHACCMTPSSCHLIKEQLLTMQLTQAISLFTLFRAHLGSRGAKAGCDTCG